MPTAEDYAVQAAASAVTAAAAATALESAANTLEPVAAALLVTQASVVASATNAATSETNAAASATAAAASYDSFDDRYLGAKAVEPTTDNDGNALLTGALYWNTPAGEMRAWSGSAWAAAYLPASGYATLAGTETLTNKTLDLTSNTLTMTLAQLNAAVSDGDVVGSVTPGQFGAIGDGITDDTAALAAAIATGKPVHLPAGYVFRFTADLTITTHFQQFGGPGKLKPVGNCGVVVSGGATGVQLDLAFESAGHTGIALKIANANRIHLRRFNGIDVFNALYIEQVNTVHVGFLWATCRGYGIKLKGSDSLRSDVIHFDRATVAVPSAQYGFDWDGNIHTVTGRVGVVGGKGVILRDTSASANPANKPAIGRVIFESDYSAADGIRIDVGLDIDLTDCYALGAAASGLYVGAAVNSREVRVSGGKFRGNTRYGIENAGGVVLYSGNSDLQANTLGATLGNVWTEMSRMALDNTAYWTIAGGNPLLVDDANDYYSYDRTSNVRQWFVGGAAVFGHSANAAIAYKPLQLPVYTFATLPASPSNGWTAVITDCNTTTFNDAAAGGGANTVKVCYLGGAWKVA